MLKELVLHLVRRPYRHLTPRYVVDRLGVMIYERRHPENPWLTADAIAWLEGWLRPHYKGLEWGCGRSTIWLARRVAHLVGAEHDAGWYTKVQQRLIEEGEAHRVSISLAQDEANYVGIVDAVETVDFALVDGVFRDTCALACVPKIRAGGIIIVDNANRYIPREQPSRALQSRGRAEGYASPQWVKFECHVRNWPLLWTTNGVTDTAIWTKPE